MDVVVPKIIYPEGSILLGLQAYLADFYVTVVVEGEDVRMTFSPRRENTLLPDPRDVLDGLQHAAFRWELQRETVELRRILLERALGAYR